jgi:hypothetical protein
LLLPRERLLSAGVTPDGALDNAIRSIRERDVFISPKATLKPDKLSATYILSTNRVSLPVLDRVTCKVFTTPTRTSPKERASSDVERDGKLTIRTALGSLARMAVSTAVRA